MALLRVGIARGIGLDDLLPAFAAALEGGFDHLEVTMNTPDAPRLIAAAAREFRGRAAIGAGTVTNAEELARALDAGAAFVVSPVTRPALIEACVAAGVPCFPGALTPTEVLQAWEAGATMVKVFPLGCVGGPDYLRELKGPLDRVKLLACGGVTAENLRAHVEAGVDGIGIGGQLFRRAWIAERAWGHITEEARRYAP